MKKSLPYYPIILFLFLYTFQVKAQDLIYKHYTTEDGLPHDITYQIIQDSKGFIWAGTDDGLVRFNGKEIKSYGFEKGLKSNYVIDVVEDQKNDQYFIATWGRGIHVLKNDSIYKYEFSDKKDLSKINKIYRVNDSIILGFSNTHKLSIYNVNSYSLRAEFLGLKKGKLIKSQNSFKFDIPDINHTQLHDKVLLYDSELNTSIGIDLEGVYEFSQSELIKLTGVFSNKKSVHALLQVNDYTIISSYNTLSFYDKSRLLEKRNLKLPVGKIIQIQENRNKVYFVHIKSEDGLRQLYSYSLENNHLVNISKKAGINSSISDFLFDTDASLWITTYGSGIYQLLNTNNLFLGDQYFEKNNLTDVITLETGVMTMAPNILYYLDEHHSVSNQKIPFHTENFVKQTSRKLDLIMPNAKYLTFHSEFKNISIGSKHSKIFEFITDTNKKIRFIDNKVKITESETDTIIPIFSEDTGVYISKAVRFKDKIYAIYDPVGMYVFDVNSHNYYIWNKEFGVPANSFADILVHKNALWLGTNTGLYKITDDKIENFTTKNGLISNHVNGLFSDHHGILWVATQRGLNVLKEGQFYHIDKNLGQRSSALNKITEFNDYLYVIGNRGMFVYDNQKPFQVQSNTKLLIDHNQTNFSVIPINYINPNTVKIQYRLNETKWTELLNDKIDFQNLEEGEYDITFRYKDGLSNWNYTNVFGFLITKPWYESSWLYVCFIVLTLMGLLFVVYKQLVRVKRKNRVFKKIISEREQLQEDLKNVRHQIAQDFHDDLGNKLASISMLSNLSLKKSDKESGLYKNLFQINKDANVLYRGMRDFVWSLDYNNNSLSEVQIYLNDFGEKLFEYSEINFKSKNNVSKSKVFLPHYWNKQLVLVFKEAMTNAFKHSKASEVWFHVFYNENVLEISLEDNGIGYKHDEKGRKNGLLNMKERIKTINGELKFSSKRRGFKVYFKGVITK